ncbi:MAG: Spo0E family sporulation regulatory protein-aspartic acid phosphatase [Ruminiclostridium sp.]|nr:Spo0E family sporulation regulatory protein-aspartic acid phosphatase [Ruminiclostridium sp.]
MGILILYKYIIYIELGELLMTETEHLKERIKSGQEKLNDLLKSGKNDMLTLEDTIRLSKELDKLIVKFQKLKA